MNEYWEEMMRPLLNAPIERSGWLTRREETAKQKELEAQSRIGAAWDRAVVAKFRSMEAFDPCI